MEDERGPGLEFLFVFCVRQSSVRGCRFHLCLFILLLKCVECSPVPASFFPYLSTSLQQLLPNTAASTLLRLLEPRLMQLFSHRDLDMWECV